jgi:hypothetical protein
MADNLLLAPPQPDFERWLAAARHAAAGGYTRDAILGGLRARLFTNHLPLAEAWSEMFFGPQEWQKRIRQTPPPQPAMTLYASVTREHGPLGAVNPAQSTAVVLNRLESSVLLDAVAMLAAHELGKQAGWVARGTCAAARERAVLVIGPSHASVAAGIADKASGQITVNDPVLMRITLTRQVDGVQLAPTRIITERGQEVTGARMLQWLRRDAYREPRADVFCLTQDGRDEPVMARDLDLDRRAEPYAYSLTRRSAGHGSSTPPLVTDIVALREKTQTAVLSLDAKTFVTRLAADHPWIPQEIVREVALLTNCHAAGVVTPPDERLQLFIAEVANRLRRTR